MQHSRHFPWVAAGGRRAGAVFLAAVLALLVGGCASTAPAKRGAVEPVQAEGPNKVEIFYATNRAPSGDPGVHFGRERGEASFGVASVGIPANHQIGRLRTPSVFRFEWSEDERKHISLRGVEPLDREEFLTRLRLAVWDSPDQRLMLFVHGYNVDFAQAHRRLAQFATDLKFSGPVLLFSWPSQASLTGYTVDASNAEWAQPHLTRLMEDLMAQTPARNIYLIAHSMGARVLTRAHNTLTADRPPDAPTPYKEMVLVAPDIDADLFREDIAPRLARSGIGVTLYASSGDRALMASKAFHGHPRAGDSGAGLVIVPGVETIDATDASSGLLGHSYFAEDRRIMEDIFGILQTGQRADNRFGLQPVETQDGKYWTFRR